jgi:EPS-associated MarR family transcriptional regulator
MINRDIHLALLRKFEQNPQYTQRELSKEMGISLGKVNYCLKKLTEKGWVKLTNFSTSSNKLGYMYLLTPQGIEQKAKLTTLFLKIKIQEFEILKDEISKLKLDSEEFWLNKHD